MHYKKKLRPASPQGSLCEPSLFARLAVSDTPRVFVSECFGILMVMPHDMCHVNNLHLSVDSKKKVKNCLSQNVNLCVFHLMPSNILIAVLVTSL